MAFLRAFVCCFGLVRGLNSASEAAERDHIPGATGLVQITHHHLIGWSGSLSGRFMPRIGKTFRGLCPRPPFVDQPRLCQVIQHTLTEIFTGTSLLNARSSRSLMAAADASPAVSMQGVSIVLTMPDQHEACISTPYRYHHQDTLPNLVSHHPCFHKFSGPHTGWVCFPLSGLGGISRTGLATWPD